MAKRGRKAKHTEAAIESFAEDLGRLLGSARNRADQWLDQRQTIAKNLEQIRDTAATLLNQLGHQAQTVKQSGAKSVAGAAAPVKRRKLSAKARRAISEAQKARWAKFRKNA